MSLFKSTIDYRPVRAALGLDGEFVVGWFGMMHRYRLVSEVLVPLIRHARKDVPNVHFLIGGKGELLEKFIQLKKDDPEAPFTLLGLVPYANLPSYIAACDVLLSPIDPSFRFTQCSAWLKIGESLAVGRPIIASRTRLTNGDFKDLKGIVWTGSDVASFLTALKEVHTRYSYFSSLAATQAADFRDYAISSTIPKVVDKIVGLLQDE